MIIAVIGGSNATTDVLPNAAAVTLGVSAAEIE
jgi:hypothetical protein